MMEIEQSDEADPCLRLSASDGQAGQAGLVRRGGLGMTGAKPAGDKPLPYTGSHNPPIRQGKAGSLP